MTPEPAADDREGLPEEAEVRGGVDRVRAHGLQGKNGAKLLKLLNIHGSIK